MKRRLNLFEHYGDVFKTKEALVLMKSLNSFFTHLNFWANIFYAYVLCILYDLRCYRSVKMGSDQCESVVREKIKR